MVLNWLANAEVTGIRETEAREEMSMLLYWYA